MDLTNEPGRNISLKDDTCLLIFSEYFLLKVSVDFSEVSLKLSRISEETSENLIFSDVLLVLFVLF